MEIIIFIAMVAFFLWLWNKNTKQESVITSKIETPEIPEIKLTVTTSSSVGNKEPTDVGELISDGNDGWILNPKSPLPLTVYNADKELAKKLKELLGPAEYWTHKIPDITLHVAQHNLRFREVDAFIAEHGAKFRSEIKRLISNSSEWADASEKDRQDLQLEFENEAIESIGVCVGHADLACLLAGEPSDFAQDDELILKFNGDSSLYAFYLYVLGHKMQVVTVKADDYNRKNWEKLFEKGFTRRGKDIPIELLLDGLRLKDINELLVGTIEKPIGRKVKAIDAALKLPDLATRLSERISYREMFQVVPPPGLDAEQLGRSFAYATALATIVHQTYYTGVRTLDAIAERKRDSGFYNAWEIKNWEDPIPTCAAPMCKKYDRLPAKRPPFHIGCVCNLEPSFKE